jgi:hypothetical protein
LSFGVLAEEAATLMSLATFFFYFDTVLNFFIVVAVVTWPFFGKKYYESWVGARVASQLAKQKHEQDKDLEKFRQSLLDDTESIKANHQRLLQDFSHYTVKRHEVYARLYGLLRMAHDYTDDLNPNRLVHPDYARAELAAVHRELRALRTSPETLKAIETVWFENRKQALNLTEGALAQGYRQRAARAYQRAANYQALNELYLSSEVASSVRMLLREIAKYQFVCNAEVDPTHVDRSQEQSSELMSKTYHAMVKELRVGDYEELNEQNEKHRRLEEQRAETQKYF